MDIISCIIIKLLSSLSTLQCKFKQDFSYIYSKKLSLCYFCVTLPYKPVSMETSV